MAEHCSGSRRRCNCCYRFDPGGKQQWQIFTPPSQLIVWGRELRLLMLISIVFFLGSCTNSSRWNLDHVQTSNSRFSSSKLFFTAKDRSNGIDVEILKTKSALRVYLSVHSQAVPTYRGDPKKALAVLFYENQKHSFIVARHEGGQHFLLSDADADLLISLLEKEVPVTIKLPGYSTQVSPEEFSIQFEKLHHNTFANPFHLPF